MLDRSRSFLTSLVTQNSTFEIPCHIIWTQKDANFRLWFGRKPIAWDVVSGNIYSSPDEFWHSSHLWILYYLFKNLYDTWNSQVTGKEVKISASFTWTNKDTFLYSFFDFPERQCANHPSTNKTIQEIVYSSKRQLSISSFVGQCPKSPKALSGKKRQCILYIAKM